MDDAWFWAAILGLAAMASGMIPFLVPQRAWALVIAPLPLVAWVLMWSLMQSPPDQYRRPLAILIGAVAGGLIMYGATELLHGKPAKAQGIPAEAAASKATVSGGDNVFSVGQIGGITARTVTINPPIQPELRILSRTETVEADGSHLASIVVEVVSPITPGLLTIRIQASGLQIANVFAAPSGGVSSTIKRNTRFGAGVYSTEIQSPQGQYIITVRTTQPTDIRLDASF